MALQEEKSTNIKIDKTDLKILDVLQNDARISLKELAAQVNLSTTPTYERWRRLERLGYIRGYASMLDPDKVHRGFTVICMVKLTQLSTTVVNHFVNVIRDIPEVSECFHISGKYDYMLRINAPDMQYYQSFIVNVLGRIESIGTIESSFVMERIKQTNRILRTDQ